jgi:uncharacterized membrane protein YesL
MDIFTFMIAIVMMMLAIQFQQNWLALGIAAVLALTTRDIKSIVLLGISAIIIYLVADSLKELWPFVVFGLIILAIIFGIGKKQEASPYSMDMGMGGGMDEGMPPMGFG